jgi:hypothetical protein
MKDERGPAACLQRGVLVLGAMALITLGTSRARASDAADGDRVLATELFKEGRALMAEKHYAEACRKLEESERLDPGGGTLLNLALCHELEGRTATAWSEFHEARAIAVRDVRGDREDQAQRHIDALESRLVRLVIVVPTDARLLELAVRRDGTEIRPAAWGAAVPIDPGQHVVDAEAPGRVPWHISIDVASEGTLQAVQVPVLEPLPAPASPAALPSAPPPPPPVRRPAPVLPVPSTPRVHQRPAALVLGGLGAVAVGLGALFGLEARSEWANAQPRCQGGCDEPGYRSWSDAKTSASLSTIAFSVGGAAIAGGVVLWLTSPLPAASIRVGAAAGGESSVKIGSEF